MKKFCQLSKKVMKEIQDIEYYKDIPENLKSEIEAFCIKREKQEKEAMIALLKSTFRKVAKNPVLLWQCPRRGLNTLKTISGALDYKKLGFVVDDSILYTVKQIYNSEVSSRYEDVEEIINTWNRNIDKYLEKNHL